MDIGINFLFRELRLISNKNVAFVEYGDEFQSTVALNALNGQKVQNYDYVLKISYAKKWYLYLNTYIHN